MTPAATSKAAPALHVTRWTASSGSNARSRGAVVIEAGDHHWRAAAEGNGAIDALLKAVDQALADVLQGHPRLLSYEVHALAEGPEAEGQVSVAIAPPSSASGARAKGRYEGSAHSTNIIASSIDAYIQALNAMLAEAHWEGAAEDAGRGRRAAETHGRRGQLDKDADDSLPWVG
jgi:hypothetical protein